jgi:hypothetical protein
MNHSHFIQSSYRKSMEIKIRCTFREIGLSFIHDMLLLSGVFPLVHEGQVGKNGSPDNSWTTLIE